MESLANASFAQRSAGCALVRAASCAWNVGAILASVLQPLATFSGQALFPARYGISCDNVSFFMRGRNGNAGGRGMRLSPTWLGTGAVQVYLGLQALTPGGGTQPSLEFSGSGLLSQVQSAPYTFFSINSLVHCANALMAAAPVESCQSLSRRSPWGRLGSVLYTYTRLHRIRRRFNHFWSISLSSPQRNSRFCRGLASRALRED